MSSATLAIVDGHYYAFKFHFGMPPLTGPGGRPTGMLYAFARLLKDLRSSGEITHLVVVMDHRDPTFREAIFPAYKAQRPPAPEPLIAQLPHLPRLCEASAVPLVCVSGFEADDVLATLAVQAAEAGMEVRMCTKDKDVDQVLSDRIRTWDPGKKMLRGPAELLAEKNITPAQVIDYLCMIGDSSDNVPGIEGIGPKTAAKLLERYGSLEGVLSHVSELSAKQQEKIAAFVPKKELTRDLITLRRVDGLPALDSFLIPADFSLDPAVYEEFGFTLNRFQPAPVVPARSASTDATVRTVSDLDGLRAVLADATTAGRIAFDTETTSLEPLDAELVGLGLAWGADDGRGAAYIPFQGLGAPLVDLAAAKPLLQAFFTNPALHFLAQNAKYDIRVLLRHGITVSGLDGDPMLASWLLDPGRESHGLDYLTKTFLGEDKIPTSSVIDLASGQTMAQVAVAEVARYCAEDAQCTWRLAQKLEADLAERGLLSAYRDQEVPFAACLARMEQAGIAVDPTVLVEVRSHLASFLASVMEGIRRIAGPTYNPNSPKQTAELLFEKLKLPVITRTKTGPSTDASVLEALRNQHEFPDLLLQHRSLTKLIGTYLDRLPQFIHPVTGRIHGHFKQTGTETGRLSSDQPNLQNIPKKSDLGREMRSAFIAAPGTVLLAADYSQIELRVLAHFSSDRELQAAFARGDDIHRFVAAQVAGVAPEAVTPQQRNAAKAVNFGIIYGQTAFGLSQQLGIPRGEAQKFIDAYFARFSGVKTFIDEAVAEATRRGFAQTLAGRRRHVPQLTSDNRNERLQGERIALNSTIQGSAADLIKRAMLRCDAGLPQGARLILQIHDELLVEAPAEFADQAAAALQEAMVGAWVLDVPLVAEVRRGRTWLDVS